MKKILTLFAVVGLIVFSSCEGPEGPPGFDGQDGAPGPPGFVSEVFELQNINFSYDKIHGYNIYQKLNPVMYDSDIILIYRLVGTLNPTTPIWQQIPRTVYTSKGELDYDFDFSKGDFTIYAGGNYDVSLTPEFLNKQTFRIVIVPGAFSNKSVNKADYSDYNEVIRKYNIDDSNVKKLN